MESDEIGGAIPQAQGSHAAFRVVDPVRTLALIQQAGDQIRGFWSWRDMVQRRATGLVRRVYEDRTLKNETIRELESHLSRMDRRNADLERALAEISSDYERIVVRCMEAEFRVIQAEHRASLAEMCAFRLDDLLARVGEGTEVAYPK